MDVSVIGGAQVYAEAFPKCQLLFITEYEHSFLHDTEFPEIPSNFVVIGESEQLYFQNIPYKVKIYMNKKVISLVSARAYLEKLDDYKLSFNFVDSV